MSGIPDCSPLGCILQNWSIFSKMIFFCNTNRPNISWSGGQNDLKMGPYTKIRVQKEDPPNGLKSLSCSSQSQTMMISIYASGSSYHSPSTESGSS